MKKELAIIFMAAGMLSAFTGCTELDEGINISIKSETTAETEEKSAAEEAKQNSSEETNIEKAESNEKNEENKTEKEQIKSENQQVKSEKEQVQSETKETVQKQSPYQYGEDIKDEGITAMKNSDGTIELSFKCGKFTLTLPAELDNHFIIKDNHLSSKAYFNDTDGFYSKMAIIYFTEEFRYYYPGVVNLLGKSGNTYMWIGGATDSDYMPEYPDDPAVKEEFELIDSNLKKIYGSAKSYNEKTGKLEKIFEFPEDDLFKGEISKDGIIGIPSDDFVFGKVTEGSAPKWPVEKGWHVTAKRAISCEIGTYYDCYDSDDGDHYGWILDGNVELTNAQKEKFK